MNKLNIYLTGIGGQGILTIADLICLAAERRGIEVNFYPTKGMAQRGGFVKVQLRLGQGEMGPCIPLGGADILISMEVSETLKGLPYLKEGGTALIYSHIWAPTAVMLGKADYPALAEVAESASRQGAVVQQVTAWGKSARGENIYLLGAAVTRTPLGQLFDLALFEELIKEKFPKAAEANIQLLRQGSETR